MLFSQLHTFSGHILKIWGLRQSLGGENWSRIHSVWIHSLESAPSCGSSLEQEGSSLLRTVSHSACHGFYYLPGRLHFLWERTAPWQYLRESQSSIRILTQIPSLHFSTVAHFHLLPRTLMWKGTMWYWCQWNPPCSQSEGMLWNIKGNLVP